MCEIKISVGANKKNLAYIDDVVKKSLEAFEVEKVSQVHFAIHEALINSIQAGEKINDTSTNALEVHLLRDQHTLKAWITDSFGGTANQAETLIDEIETLPILRESGRGLMLSSHLVDKIEWKQKEDKMFEVFILVNDEKQ